MFLNFLPLTLEIIYNKIHSFFFNFVCSKPICHVGVRKREFYHYAFLGVDCTRAGWEIRENVQRVVGVSLPVFTELVESLAGIA